MINIQGYESIDSVLEKGTRELTPREFELVAEETEAVIIDTRSKDEFRKGFVPKSIFIGIDGSFATWVGTLIPDVKQELLIIADEGKEEEVVTRLARVGYDNAKGYLKGGFKAWKAEGRDFDTVESVDVNELANVKDAKIVDVRKNSEFQSEHVLEATNAPLDYVNESMKKILNDEKQYVHCASGYRSLVFISILQARGYRNLVDIKGGFKSIKESGKFEVTEYVCPTTLL
jgi:rhodanese-related sulfurtransferase